jgi:hypothetical protein
VIVAASRRPVGFDDHGSERAYAERARVVMSRVEGRVTPAERRFLADLSLALAV